MADDMPTRTSALAQAVRQRRHALSLTQERLADLAGCSERFVYGLENGRATLRIDKVLDVMGVLGLGLSVGPGHGNVVAEAPPREGIRTR